MKLQNMLHLDNSYFKSFKFQTTPVVINLDAKSTGSDAGRFNAPACNEIVIVNQEEQHNQRDILLQYRDKTHETHRS